MSKLVLVVDDEAMVGQMIKDRLAIEGYQADVVGSGKRALEHLISSNPLCILLDLGLPDLDGFEVLKRIKSFKPRIPVIIVTGSHDESEGRRALELGARDYIAKPIDFIYLLNELAMMGTS